MIPPVPIAALPPVASAPATGAGAPFVTQHATQIVGSPAGFLNDWCVYEHYYGENDTLIYIGLCRLIDVFSAPDARNNSEWVKLVNDTYALTLRIIATGTRANCFAYHGHHMTTRGRPVCNARGVHAGARNVIECIETGARFNTQEEASRGMGVSQSAISQHLQGKPNFARVKGYTFRRVPADAPRSVEQPT